MKNSKIITIAVILLVVAALVIIMSLAVKDAASNAKTKNEEEQVRELVVQVNSYDYTIYWIGTPPQNIADNLGQNINTLSLAEVTSETLPVSTSFADLKVYDDEGNLINHIPAADYSANMLIVVGNDVVVDDIHWDIIRKAIVGNRVPCLIIGKTNINAFRDMMFLTRHTYGDNDTMLYDKFASTSDNLIVGENLGDWMQFLIDIFDAPAPTPVVVSTEPPIFIEVPEETSVDETIAEETTPEEIIVTEETDGN